MSRETRQTLGKLFRGEDRELQPWFPPFHQQSINIVRGSKKPAFFKIPQPAPGCRLVIRRPIPDPDVTVQNCGMITAAYTKATCALPPRPGDNFMVQTCCGDECFDASPNPQPPTRRRSIDDTTADSDDDTIAGSDADADGDVVSFADAKEPLSELFESYKGMLGRWTYSWLNHWQMEHTKGGNKEPKPWPVHFCNDGHCRQYFCGPSKKCRNDPGCSKRKKKCKVNTSCPAVNRARNIRGNHTDERNPYGVVALEKTEQRLAEENNINLRFTLGQNMGDLGLGRMERDRDRKQIYKTSIRSKFRFCLKRKSSWLPFGHYTKPDERTQIVRGPFGPDGPDMGEALKGESRWSTSLPPDSLTSDSSFRKVFGAVMYHTNPPCGIFDTLQESLGIPANRSGYLGFTPVLECTVGKSRTPGAAIPPLHHADTKSAAHACGNVYGDAQVHEFCVPMLNGDKGARGYWNFIADS